MSCRRGCGVSRKQSVISLMRRASASELSAASSDCNQTRQLILSAQTDLDVFTVERITDCKYDFEKQEFLLKIKWAGFADAFQTWEPVNHMLNYCRHLTIEFRGSSHD